MEIPRFWRWHQEVVWPFARSALQAQIAEAAEKLHEAQQNYSNYGDGDQADNTSKESVVVLELLEEATTAE